MIHKQSIVVRAILDETTGRLREIIPIGTRNQRKHLLTDAESIISITKEMLDKLNYFAKK